MFSRIVWLFLLICCSVSAQNTFRNLSKENWTFNKQNDIVKYQATIPGTIHTDLFQNQLISDPFFGANEKELKWIENENWEYKTTFVLTKEELQNQNIDLQFEGLDTYASVYLNDILVLAANNMFRSWNISVKNKLKTGKNHLKVIFKSAVEVGKQEAQKLSYTLPGDEKVFTRKAQYHYGWDWGPCFVTAGIWKQVKLHFWNTATIQNVRFEQAGITEYDALLFFNITVNSQMEGDYVFVINGNKYKRKLPKGATLIELPYTIENPKLWWCNGLGEAHLYDFDISIHKKRKEIDSNHLKIGLRTIELVQGEDEKGKSFYFKLNGIPVFMKGANYIPSDSFVTRVDAEKYKKVVENAKNAHMNMLRVWGGGIYENDAFYDECDKNGILVWQDFMFACAMYPGDTDFVQNVKQEVIDNVNCLQNHPSIALWCGNNEVDEGWHNWGWQKQYQYTKSDSTKVWNDYKTVFHEVIPKTLDSLVSKEKNVYWSSSPSIGWGRKESLLKGDSHYWGVWWGMEPFEMYTKKVGRFMSEYGFQGMPSMETLQKVIRKEDLNFNSDAVKNHQKHPTGYETIKTYMERDFQVPDNFENYAYISQLLQAEGMKTAIEAHRRAKPYCMGTLYWQLNDCWPVTSWSSVDYYGNWKALHYQVKRSYKDVILSPIKEENAIKVYAVNDNLQDFEGDLNVQLLDFDGEIVWSATEKVTIASNTSAILKAIKENEFSLYDLSKSVLKVIFTSDRNALESLYFFEKSKHLKLTQPNIQIKRLTANSIEITTDVLAKNVMLFSDEPTHFSDNYFDLLPSEKRLITFSNAVEQIQFKSLFDTIKKPE